MRRPRDSEVFSVGFSRAFFIRRRCAVSDFCRVFFSFGDALLYVPLFIRRVTGNNREISGKKMSNRAIIDLSSYWHLNVAILMIFNDYRSAHFKADFRSCYGETVEVNRSA